MKTSHAIGKGVNFVELWKDMRKNPSDYASAAFSAFATGLWVGAKRFSPWSAVVSGTAGIATGIVAQYIVTHNFEEGIRRPTHDFEEGMRRPVKTRIRTKKNRFDSSISWKG